MDSPKQNNDYEQEPISKNAVRYLDGSSLLRTFRIPQAQKIIMLVVVIIGAIIGMFLLRNVLEVTIYASARNQEALQNTLNREVTLDLPMLSQLIKEDDKNIRASFEEAGFTTYEKAVDDEGNILGFDVIKLPVDVSVEEAGLTYLQGLTAVEPNQAIRILNGSWNMTVERTNGVLMKIRYADFTSEGVDAAIETAIAAEELQETELGEAGVDSAGNTYQMGSVEINGTKYEWKVSACLLSEIYDIDGLPENAVYLVVSMNK